MRGRFIAFPVTRCEHNRCKLSVASCIVQEEKKKRGKKTRERSKERKKEKRKRKKEKRKIEKKKKEKRKTKKKEKKSRKEGEVKKKRKRKAAYTIIVAEVKAINSPDYAKKSFLFPFLTLESQHSD